MKALRINDYGAPLHLDDVPIPTAGPGQVLVENYFTRAFLFELYTLKTNPEPCLSIVWS